MFQWPAQAPLLQRLQSRQQGGLTDNTVERLRELGIYREQEEEEEVMENLEGGILLSGIHSTILTPLIICRYCQKDRTQHEAKKY